MIIQKSIYSMTDKELRNYKWMIRRKRTLRKELLSLLMTMLFIIVCLVFYHSIRTSANTGKELLNFKYYTQIEVNSGETLWTIADDYIDYEQYKDKNAYLAEVQSINHLKEDSLIKTGQTLIVPYYSTEFVQ